MYDQTCIFCREIIKNDNAAYVYKDNDVIAFMDNAPIEKGHVLVIPREHFANVFDIDKEIYTKTQLMVKKIAMAVKLALETDGINIGQNNGRAANQVVMHYHVHIIPRYYRRNINWEREIVDMESLKTTADKIIKELMDVKT